MQISDFRPSTKRKKWGLGLLVTGLSGVVVFLSDSVEGIGIGPIILGVLIYVGVSVAGLFLILKEPDPARAAAKAAKEEHAIELALGQLESATGARAVIAHEKLTELVVKENNPETHKRLKEALESINFDNSRVESQFLGSLTNLAAGISTSGSKRQVRIYKDWVIAGDIGYNFDVSTRGQVHKDGGVIVDNKGKRVDATTATLQLATQDWSHTFNILPNEANEARRILNQLSAIVDEMKPKGATALDVESAMEKLASKSGKSQAERLEELSNLRYQRLLSDQEFEKAKAKILEI